MVDFSRQLQQRDINPKVVSRSADTSTAELIGAAGNALETGLDIRDQGIQSDFADSIGEVNAQEERFLTEKQSALDELKSSLGGSDAAAIDKAHSRLRTIQQGEDTGKLSPAAAQARRTSLFKEQLNASPWLAPELKQLARGSSGSGLGGGGATISPEEEGLNQLRLISARTLTPLSKVIENAQLEQEAKLRQNRAVIAFPDVQDRVFDMATASRVALTSQFLDLARSGTLDQGQAQLAVDNLESQLIGEVSNRKRELSSQGILMTEAQENQLRLQIKDELSILDTFVKNENKVQAAEDVRDLLKATSAIEAHKAGGPLNQLRDFWGPLAPKMITAALQTKASVQRGSTFEQIQFAAKEGDEQATLALAAINAPGGAGLVSLMNTMGGEPMDNLVLGGVRREAAKNVLADNTITERENGKEYRSRAAEEIRKSPNPRDITTYLNSKVFVEAIKNPAEVQGIKNAVEFNLPAVIDSAKLVGDDKVVVQGESFVLDEASREESSVLEQKFVTGAAARRPAKTTANRQALRTLNDYRKLVQKYGLIDDIVSWTDAILNDINSVEQEPVVPAAEQGLSQEELDIEAPVSQTSARTELPEQTVINLADDVKAAKSPEAKLKVLTDAGLGIEEIRSLMAAVGLNPSPTVG